MKKKFEIEKINKKWHPFFERIFYRRFSNWLTPKISKITTSPNLITLIGFLLGLAGIIMIAFGDYHIQVFGALILIFSYIFDCVDGELARGCGAETKFGAFLDTTLDSLKESFIFTALAYSYYSQTTYNKIFILLVLILFLQRMLGRSIVLYQSIFKQDVPEIKEDFLKDKHGLLKILAIFFSEAYRSGTIWIVVFIGIVLKQIPAIFYYFIFVLSALFLFLIYSAYSKKCENLKK